MGYADELGSGVRNMYKYSRVYSGGFPELSDGDKFVTVIPLVSKEEEKKAIDNRKQMIVDHIKRNGSISSTEAAGVIGLEKRQTVTIINEMVNDNIIIRKGKGPATKYNLKR